MKNKKQRSLNISKETEKMRDKLDRLGTNPRGQTSDMIDIFMEKLYQAMKQHIPTTRTGRKKGNTPLSPEARLSIRKKHRKWEKYRQKKDNESYREYTKARNKAKSIITRERKNKEKQIAETANTNCKSFSSYVNSKRKTKSGVSELHTVQDGTTVIATTDIEKAEILAEFFSSVFTNENDNDIMLENVPFKER